MNIGCHLSISKGFKKACEEAISIGANSFQFFTRNPRGGRAKDLDSKDLIEMKRIMEEKNFSYLFAHGSYTMNLCSDKEETRTFAKGIFKDDLERLKAIEKAVYVFHPGSHVKQGADKGIELIIEAMNEAIGPDNETWILLEGMSGKGTEIGRSMEELRRIIDGVEYNDKVGVCLDTCHLYSSGYDIVNDLDSVVDHIDEVIGLERVQAVHLNDSLMPYASNKDRHAALGEGTIGLDALVEFVNHPRLKHLTFNLETPQEILGYKKEIELMKSLSVD